MLFDRRKTLALLGTVTSSLPFVGPARAESPPGGTTIEEAYVYLLGRVLVIRQEHTDLTGTGITYNEIKYNPLGSADFVNPNFDVAYLEA
jgi:hypothetical protein